MKTIEKPRRNLLIVDDEPELLEILGTMVEMQGYSYETATDGQEALAKIRSFDFHAIMSDISMPNLDGVELLRFVQAKNLVIPLIFVTAFDSSEQVQEALRLGAFDFVTKPFRTEDLNRVTARAIDFGKRSLKIQSQVLEAMGTLSSAKEVLRESKMLGLLRAQNRLKKVA